MKSTKFKYLSVNIIIIYLIFAVANIVYPLDKISFNQQTENGILVTSKMDLTKLPRGEIYKVVHELRNHSEWIKQSIDESSHESFNS